MKVVRLGTLYFLSVFALGMLLGTIRYYFLAPRIGAIGAVAVELPVMLCCAWLFYGLLTRQIHLSRPEAAGVGAIAFLLLMVAEAVMSMLLLKLTFREHAALLLSPSGMLGLSGQILFGFVPLARSCRFP